MFKKKKILMLATAVALMMVATATALAASPSASDHSSTKGVSGKGTSAKTNKDFVGMVDIGGGRKMYMECQGKGAPTIVFVSGAGNSAETWSETIDPSERALLPAIAETNRVCAYDRPGTIVAESEDGFEPSRSDPAPQPTTLEDGVADLHALLGASGERGPFVLVGHSMGGTISKLYASEYPRDVSGLVLIDYLPYEMRKALTDEQWRYWKLLQSLPEEVIALYPDVERFDHQRNLEQALATAPLKPMPLIVLSADEPFDLTPAVQSGLLPADVAGQLAKDAFRATLEARDALVSRVPGARHITDTHSGHFIHQERTQLVIDSVREVVEAARKKSCALGVKNHGQCVKAEGPARR